MHPAAKHSAAGGGGHGWVQVAHEAIPTDMDFPAADNLVVLWLDKQEGLRASDSTHESHTLTENIKCQPWAQYLLMRSGRWGQVHAQL